VESALSLMALSADSKNVELVVQIDESCPTVVVGDVTRFRQVVVNLLSNAVKFTPKGEIVVTVTSGPRPESGEGPVRLIVTVRDTGIGIPADRMDRVFRSFAQVDSSTTRKFGGLGLGLAIVRHLVELHGGSVWAESPGLGQGSIFTVELPVRALASDRPEATSDGAAQHAAARPDSLSLLLGVKILVTDDDEDSRLLLQTALERVGAWVRVADSAASAFSFLEQQRVDVLISDIGMPEEDGISLMRRLRALSDNQRLQAIALSAYARSEDVTRALEAGFQRHVAKPADVGEVARTVAELVEQAALGRG